MFRLTALLCLGLYAALLIGGADRGQLREGLREARAEAEAAARARPEAPAPTARAPAAQGPAAQAAAIPGPQPLPEARITQAVVRREIAPPPVIARRAEPAPAPAAAEPAATEKVLYVTGRSVNVRSGPSTDDEVLGRLTRGEAVTLVWVEADGWARIRLEGDGIDGFMSMEFLSETAP
jgi:hypothetical protein